jgi:hypothetical protein
MRSNVSESYLEIKMINGIKGKGPLGGVQGIESHRQHTTTAYKARAYGAKSPGDFVESIDYDLVGIIGSIYSYCILWLLNINPI